MKGRGKKFDINSLLKNRNVLYVVLFLAIMNLFSYLMLKKLDAVAFFVITGFLMTYFSKNMIIVLGTSIISTFILVQINLLSKNVYEGMKGADEDKTIADMVEDSKKTSADKTEKEPVAETSAKASESADTSVKADTKSMADADALNKLIKRPTASSKSTLEGVKEKETFTQPLNPARYNKADDDDVPRHKPKVDYAATLESAYDNLDKLLSSDAIKSMSEDTNRLAEKQQKLMGNIEKLSPIMDKASSLLSNIDIGGITGLMQGMQERLSGFGMDSSEFKGAPEDLKSKK